METIGKREKDVAIRVLKNEVVDSYGRDFLEELFESLDLVYSYEDCGENIEYYSEDGTVLFLMEVSDETCTFKFYENEYIVDKKIFDTIMSSLQLEYN